MWPFISELWQRWAMSLTCFCCVPRQRCPHNVVKKNQDWICNSVIEALPTLYMLWPPFYLFKPYLEVVLLLSSFLSLCSFFKFCHWNSVDKWRNWAQISGLFWRNKRGLETYFLSLSCFFKKTDLKQGWHLLERRHPKNEKKNDDIGISLYWNNTLY